VLCALLLLSALPVLVLRWMAPPTSAFMLAHALAGGDVDYRWRSLEAIAPALPLALVAAEDQRFPHHHGFDVQAIRKAVAEHAEGGDLRGASTISQQVAKNLFLWSGRSFVRKGLEAYYTGLIELAWPKRRILEVYANIAEFGPGVYGAEAAARRYFGTGAEALAPAQAALLAAVLPNPLQLRADAPSGYVRRRQQWILRQASQLGPGHLAGCCAPAAASR
jgi:monofunctional biosynthetic peptidoglycan transglycosylase